MNYIRHSLEISHRRLYRPVGIYEWKKIAETDCKKFPPRLPSQPIFYPVLNREYAVQIAREWNTKDENSGYCGLVTEFWVERIYLDRFQIKQVGSQIHREYWIPAEELEKFNEKIDGEIQVIEVFYGDRFCGDRMKIV